MTKGLRALVLAAGAPFALAACDTVGGWFDDGAGGTAGSSGAIRTSPESPTGRYSDPTITGGSPPNSPVRSPNDRGSGSAE